MRFYSVRLELQVQMIQCTMTRQRDRRALSRVSEGETGFETSYLLSRQSVRGIGDRRFRKCPPPLARRCAPSQGSLVSGETDLGFNPAMRATDPTLRGWDVGSVRFRGANDLGARRGWTQLRLQRDVIAAVSRNYLSASLISCPA